MNRRARPSFSVVIPTLQRSSMLHPLVDALCASSHVGEVIIVNNADRPLDFASPKARTLDQERNIFVNAAWNLGVREARFPNVCISNDDLAVDTRIFALMARVLHLPVGIVAPSAQSFRDVERGLLTGASASRGPFRIRPIYRRTEGFGTLMFLRKSHYREIPESMRIWFGDDYLFHQQRRRNFVFDGIPVHTPMSQTCSDQAFNSIFWDDRETYLNLEKGPYEELFGREPTIARRAVAFGRGIRLPHFPSR